MFRFKGHPGGGYFVQESRDCAYTVKADASGVIEVESEAAAEFLRQAGDLVEIVEPAPEAKAAIDIPAEPDKAAVVEPKKGLKK